MTGEIKLNDKSRHTVLIVDDETINIKILSDLLKDDMQVLFATNGEDGISTAHKSHPDLILLDIMMPGMDGYEVCRRLKTNPKTKSIPVIFVTAMDHTQDQAAGLELGALDYITKPFSIKELVARINAVMRRAASNVMAEEGSERKISKGELEIDLEKQAVSIRGQEIPLTATEFNLLTLLIRQPGRVYSRKQLLDIVWDYSFEGYENTVNTHVNRLRSKIEKNPNNPEYVLTVWGVGYKFSDEIGV